jgi:hypothetical protein
MLHSHFLCYAWCRNFCYSLCHSVECQFFIAMLSIFLLNGIILGVVSGIFILSVVMLSDGLLSVKIFIAKPSAILLKVIMPSVVI